MGDTTDELLTLAKRMSSDPPRRELDMLLTCGERISMALLSMALQEQAVPAISFTGSQSGIITDDAHSQARIVEVRPVRIREELAKGRVVIVAGYQGVSRNREVTTLGRGGSDTTAVALAAALGAEVCEIYSDVDGVFSADPRVVPEAGSWNPWTTRRCRSWRPRAPGCSTHRQWSSRGTRASSSRHGARTGAAPARASDLSQRR
jgi:aspartate kinase